MEKTVRMSLNHKEIREVQAKTGSVRDFPGGPLAKTPHSQCRGPGFNPLVSELDPTCHN